MKRFFLLLIILFVVAEACATISVKAPSYISEAHAKVLIEWLEKNRPYRIATDEDCNCREEILETRKGDGAVWLARPQYHPYYVVGDFNWDGILDFAVGVTAKKGVFKVLIFHGPFSGAKKSKAAYVSQQFPLGLGLHFGDPRPLPHRLIVGGWGTEGMGLLPTPEGYKWDE